MKIFAKIRLLPITIFASALMLTVKVGDIWKGVDGLLTGSIAVSDAKAQQTSQPTSRPAAKKKPEKAKKKNGNGAKKAAGAAAEGNTQAPSEAASMATTDPTLLTQAEIDLLQQLADRREILDTREKNMALKQGLLKAAEIRIDKKVDKLKQLQATIQNLIKTYNKQQSKKLDSLVKIYENMKPKDAAQIFQQLDMDTLLMVVERMKERKLAGIMAKMDRAKASEITVELARLRNLPNQGAVR
jgi:flagellar motility protein MotE (MotC chaperone)